MFDGIMRCGRKLEKDAELINHMLEVHWCGNKREVNPEEFSLT
jgi:hypothetical protein